MNDTSNDSGMEFAEALLSCDNADFERILYDEVRTQAFTVCAPQVMKPPENLGSDSFGESDFESGKSEYCALEKTLFRSFEQYIAGRDIMTSTEDSGECANRLECHLRSLAPAQQGICGRIFQANEPTYCCRDCAMDPTCVLCRACFFNSAHMKHNYKISTSSGVGYCDCGDPEAWRSDAWCELHKGSSEHPEGGDIEEKVVPSKLDDINDIDVKLKAELDHLRQRINSLPPDVVRRTGRLLKPLLNSAALCLTDLIQGTHRLTTEILSSQLRKGGSSITESSSETGVAEEKVLIDDLWSTDDGVVDYTLDNEGVWESWPPPMSHIPLVLSVDDALTLGYDNWPRTASMHRSLHDVEARCLAQLERARIYHPRLFPPRPMRTASDRTAASRAFLVLLYNNEYHNYEQVIKTLRRVLDCTTQEGTHHAVLVNCDGRTVLQMNFTITQAANLASALMRTSTSLSSRPLKCEAQHADIYSLEVFFSLFLRWLRRFCDQVPSLRPVICHAILGHFPEIDNAVKKSTQPDILPILPHSDMVKDDSFLSFILARHSLSWRSVRQEMLRLIMSVLLKDNFYRAVFAIKFSRLYTRLLQNHIYDDHLDGDTLCSLSCQFYTVTSLARQLLEHNSVLSRLLSRLASAFEFNSILLPHFYLPTTYQNIQVDIQEELTVSNLNNDANISWLNSAFDLLRRLNPFEWGLSTRAMSPANCSYVNPRVLAWPAGNTLGRSLFHPFERLFGVIHDVDYILASLTNVRPLANDEIISSSSTTTRNSWWTQAARLSYMEYIRKLLYMLSFVQDMNGMQRQTQAHVEEELEWASGFYIMSVLISLLGLTVQVASSDYELYKLVLCEARQAFEMRIGIMDRRFRIRALSSIDEKPEDSKNTQSNDNPDKIHFHSLGVTTEVYIYDVLLYRISSIQPIPRFLASLYGHGLEMGLTFRELGLLDQAFLNLLIERPLQIFAFCAQYNAKMWVRNGYAAQQSITNLFNPSMRVELVDRDIQLLQIASCVLPPDEFIIRLVHKFHLGNYLRSDASSKEPGPGRVQAVEMLLRVLLSCITNRSRPSIGQFTKEYYLCNNNRSIGSNCLNDIVLDMDSEIYYPNLISDVIHTLCSKPLSYSELLSMLPYQSTSCLLMKINTEELDVLKQQHHSKDSDAEMTSEESQSTASCSMEIGPRPVLPASVSRSANKRAMENALPKILRKVAVQSSVNGRTLFSLRPEILAYRFDRFYWGYRQPEQTTAEASVSKCLKKWIQEQNNPDLKNLPIPPPPPRPLHSFIPSVRPGPLRLLRSVTFVRLIKTLLEIANSHGTAASWWSHSLLDLVLHLIIVALYEDELEGSKTGRYPFLEAVARVPVENESDIQLRQLALSHHWLKPSPDDHLKISAALEDNCITSRLLRILNSSYHDEQSDLIRWTLNHWSKVVENITGDQTPSETINKPSPYQLCNTAIKQDRAEKARSRRSRIMARMSNMQKNFMNSLSQNETAANESESMNANDPQLNDNGNQQAMQTDPVVASAVQQCALGPTRLLGGAAFILDGLSPTPGGTSAAPNAELVTCNLCLEEMPEQVSSRMVMAAHVCRSSVLSSRGIGWLEGPVTMVVVRRLSSENRMIDSQASISVDNQSQTEDSVDLEDDNYRKQLRPFLASVATTAIAASRGSSVFGFGLLPELICGVRCLEVKNDNLSEASYSMDIDSDYTGIDDIVLAAQQMSDSHDNGRLILDPWHPRPLVSSRDPIAEEGSFLSFCSHPMHATCKTKYARQLKGRIDHINRRNSSILVFDFRCPLCKCISTLDLPILGPVYSDLPVEWLSLRLLPSGDRQSNPNNVDFRPLSSWLCSLARWLEIFSDSKDYVLGDYLQSDCSPFTECTSAGNSEEPTMIEPCLLKDYSMQNVNNMISRNVNLLKQSLCTFFSQPLDKILVDLDLTLPSLEDLGVSENCEIVSKLVHSLVERIRHSVIQPEENNGDNGKCTSQVDSASASLRRNINSILNPMTRHFFTNRRSSRRSSDTSNIAGNSSNSANNNNTTINGRIHSRNLLPSHSSPLVTSNLFTFVQRLASLCQPRSLDSLVQRPNIRRGTEVTEVVVNNAPVLVAIPDEDNQVEGGYVEADDEVQVNLYANNPTLPVPDQNVQLVITQTEYNTTADDGTTGVTVTGNSVTPSVTSPNTEQSFRDQLPFSSNNPIETLSDAIELFYSDFLNLYTCLHAHGASFPYTTTTMSQPPPATTPSSSKSTLAELERKTACTNDYRGIISSYDFLKKYVDCVIQAARNVVCLASSDWRALRHSVAYTLIVSERTLRLNCSHDNFFNGGLAERRLCGLGNLLRVSFAAHSRHAVVSRGCPISCDTNDSKSSNHRYCWPHLRSHPIFWWWWSYCVPFDSIPKSQLQDIPSGCRLNNPSTISDIAETAVSVAATEDAAFLWRLLIPLSGEYANIHSRALDDDCSLEELKQDTCSQSPPYSSKGSMSKHPTSVLWDVDITFLFISLLHLRPGLEGNGVSDCQCTRLAQEADSNIASESGAALLGAHLLACDEGRPRQPIGDSHETHLLRLCYTALLVQTLLAWEPKMNCLDYLKSNNLIPQSCTWDDASIKSVNWDLPELLEVWVFLRGLSGLPSIDLPHNDPAYLAHLTQSLSLFLRANCLPFLRIAAFVMHKITGVDVPADFRQPTSADNMSDNMHEHSLLLAYLGLPSTPRDLLSLLSSPLSPSPSSSDLNSLRSVSEANMSIQSTNVSMLCESLWLARLVTIWCLTGEQSLSRKFYNSLCSRYMKSSLLDNLLPPYPNVHLPRLIDLPKEYTHLLLLAMDMDCHAEGHIHSDLSLCLVCGHLACLLCYGCRQFEQKSNSIGGTLTSSNFNSNRNVNSSGSNQEFAVYRMQAHSRRCHSGYSFLLRIHSCRVIMLSDQARRMTEVPAPYRDSFGETDPDLRRGNPLFLVESEYRHINKLWVSHQLTSSTSSELVTPLNLQYEMLSSSLTEKSAKKSKSGFKGLSRSKKHKKSNVDDIDTTNVSSTTNITTTLPTSIISSTSLLNNKSSKMKTSFQIVTNDDAKLSSPLSVVPTAENISNSKSKRKIKKKELKQKKVSEQSNMDTAIPIPATAQQPVKSKKKRGLKLHSHKTVLSGEKAVKIVTKPIFGVPLDVACNRNPSHDEVMLPAFFRHCIDYIEQYGLSSEGIYRVPGVHSQVQAVISSIDNGQEFPDIPPTSATFYHNQDVFTKHRSSHFLIGTTDINFKGKTRHLSSSYTGAKEFNSILSPKISENRGVVTPPSAGFISTAFSVKNPMASVGSCSSNAGVGAGSNDSPAKHLLPTSSLIAPNAATSVYPQSTLPHDPAVIASVIKQFLRSLPESILTKRLSNVIESLSTDTVQFYHNLSALVHQELPVSNRYLLAWIIQHMMHIIDRAGENRMTLANIIIVLSPCLGISHRLLSILLNPTPPKDFSLDLCKLDPKLPAFNPDKSNIDPSTWHWLFPHPVYLLRPYIPPLKLIHGLELPDSNEELDVELKKQESLLAHLCEEIKLGETSPGKEYLLRDVQHIITEIKRRKALTDPEAIRQEIIKQQTQLDRLHLAIAQCATIDAHSDTSSGLSQLKDTSTSGQRRRITGSDKSSKSHHHHHSHRHHNTDHLHQLTDKKIPYSDELWEVQRQITMLKRKLKQHEKLNEQQQQPQSSLTAITNSEMMGTTMATAVQEASSISPLPSSSSTTTCHSPSVLYMSGAPLIIPSVSELDQEEVLNLTLRKLAIEPSITTTMTTTTATITSTIDELNCSTTVNNNTRNGDGNTIVYSSQTTASSENDNTTLVKEATPISSSTVINQRDETNVCMTNLSETNNASLDFKSSTSKSQNNKESLNNTVMSIHDTDAPASVTTIPSSEQLPHNNNENQFDENLISCAASETQQKNSIIQAIDREVHPEFIHQTYASPRDYDEVFSRNSIKTTAPNTLLSHYLMTDSPSLPPPPDLAPKLTEFIEPSAIMFTNTNTTMMTTTSTFIQDPNQRQMMYYKARKQELIAIQADLKARIRSENAEINRLQLCINHLLESGGRRARRIYRTYVTAKHLCPPWLYNQNPIISTSSQHNMMSGEEEDEEGKNDEKKLNWHISQPWTKIAENLTNLSVNPNLHDDDDDDDVNVNINRYKNPRQYNGVNKQKEKCLLDEEDSSDSDSQHHRHSDEDEDDDDDNDNEDGDEDSLEEPILLNRNSSPDSVAYSRLTEEGEDDENDLKHLVDKKCEESINSDNENQAITQDDKEEGDDEEDDDDDDDECELELATTLHQLTLDNARLEQLNARSLEAIQAERDRCADLKVLLKLRHNSYMMKPMEMMESSTSEFTDSLHQHSSHSQSQSITA